MFLRQQQDHPSEDRRNRFAVIVYDFAAWARPGPAEERTEQADTGCPGASRVQFLTPSKEMIQIIQDALLHLPRQGSILQISEYRPPEMGGGPLWRGSDEPSAGQGLSNPFDPFVP